MFELFIRSSHVIIPSLLHKEDSTSFFQLTRLSCTRVRPFRSFTPFFVSFVHHNNILARWMKPICAQGKYKGIKEETATH